MIKEYSGIGRREMARKQKLDNKLVAPDAPDLTIIDLPGIVRTATEGQEASIVEQIDGLIEKYLKQPRTIILAVVGANVDIATNEIIERAIKVDPEGIRTMGVLTKPDLVDAGAEHEVMGVLSNRTKPLRHGYVMLKNRSQVDLDKKMTLAEARDSERRWFEASIVAELKMHAVGANRVAALYSNGDTGSIESLVVQYNRPLFTDSRIWWTRGVVSKIEFGSRVHLNHLKPHPKPPSKTSYYIDHRYTIISRGTIASVP